MKIAQITIRHLHRELNRLDALTEIQPQLVLVFASPALLSNPLLDQALSQSFPAAQRVGCSTAGEISTDGVQNTSAVITALHFDEVAVQVVSTDLESMDDSEAAGGRLAEPLSDWRAQAVLVFGQGVNINGSAMIDGMVKHLGPAFPLVGGLAGDDGKFRQTYTLCNQGVSSLRLVAVGLKGPKLRFSHGCFGGWKPFGPARKVTRAHNNVLYELDGSPALSVYKSYLGEYAKDLPGSGLLFPFEMLGGAREPSGLIRTILGVNPEEGSLTLAGAIEPNGYLRLMHAQTDGLVDGAEQAAMSTLQGMTEGDRAPGLALLVSCVGRKLVMGGRVDEEIEIVQDTLGSQAILSGFYSNGEISPGLGYQNCQLHNQTMTISYLTEAA